MTAKVRSAEEIAREMVIVDRYGARVWDGEDQAPILYGESRAPAMRGILERLIQRSRDEGADAAQQRRDLAGRIRALVQEKAGEWADAVGADAAALREAMGLLRCVAQGGSRNEDVIVLIRQLRSRDGDNEQRANVFRRVADELEAIARDAVEER